MNKQLVALPYKKYGLQVYESGINFVVDIPRLKAQISYNGMYFSIRLPYELFGNNTKGQCGESLQPLPLEGKDMCEHLSPSCGFSAPLWTVTGAMSCVWHLREASRCWLGLGFALWLDQGDTWSLDRRRTGASA